MTSWVANRSRSPELRGLKNPAPLSKCCLARYSALYENRLAPRYSLVRFNAPLLHRYKQKSEPRAPSPNFMQAMKRGLICPLIQDHFFVDEAMKLDKDFDSADALILIIANVSSNVPIYSERELFKLQELLLSKSVSKLKFLETQTLGKNAATTTKKISSYKSQNGECVWHSGLQFTWKRTARKDLG